MDDDDDKPLLVERESDMTLGSLYKAKDGTFFVTDLDTGAVLEKGMTETTRKKWVPHRRILPGEYSRGDFTVRPANDGSPSCLVLDRNGKILLDAPTSADAWRWVNDLLRRQGVPVEPRP